MAASDSGPASGPATTSAPPGGAAPGHGTAASTGGDPIAPVGHSSVLGISFLVLGAVLILGTLVALWSRRRR